MIFSHRSRSTLVTPILHTAHVALIPGISMASTAHPVFDHPYIEGARDPFYCCSLESADVASRCSASSCALVVRDCDVEVGSTTKASLSLCISLYYVLPWRRQGFPSTSDGSSRVRQ